jgi:hypothetical protein
VALINNKPNVLNIQKIQSDWMTKILCIRNQNPKANVNIASDWVMNRIFFEITLLVNPANPIAKKKQNIIVLMKAFGGPSTDASVGN